MVVSLKANKKRILAFLILAAVVVGACIFLWGGKDQVEKKEYPGGTNEERVAFLQSFGWEVDADPAETRDVMIPAQFNDVYTTYNVMQKAQGFDLKPYAGEACTQYKYKINNYPDEPEVYATLLVCGNLIVGGDVACAEVDGFMHGFAKDSARYGETGSGGSSPTVESQAPMESSQPEIAVSSAAESSAVESAPAESTAVESQTQSEPAESTAGEAVPEEAFPTD